MRYRMGDLVEQVTEVNSDLKYGLNDIVGVTLEKQMIPTIANLTQTNLDNFIIVHPKDFVYNPRTHGKKIGLGFNTTDRCFISTWNNNTFRVKPEMSDVIMPEYLYMYFLREKWDKEACFNAWGSSTVVLLWSSFCDMKINVPSLPEQRKIVHDYQVITDRIELLRKMNENLEGIAFTHFQDVFAKAYTDDTLPDGWTMGTLDDVCDVKGGKRLPADCELTDTKTSHPYIRVRDVGASRYVCLTDQYQYIDDATHEAISRYIVNTGDIVISIVGTIGLIGKIHKSLDGANLTENCVRLTHIKSVTSDYLYYTLQYKKQTKEIELLTVGAVQAKLPMYNIQGMKVVIPDEDVLASFQERINAINSIVEANTVEMQSLTVLAKSFFTMVQKGA